MPWGWLYLTSDRPPAPSPFPVPRWHTRIDRCGKMTLEGRGSDRFYTERGNLCAACVTVWVVTYTAVAGPGDAPATGKETA
jgi:hypothetical protein